MITNKAKIGIEPIDFNKVCNLVKTDLLEKFKDNVLSVRSVKHKVNHAILTLTITFKRKGPKNQAIDTDTIDSMVDYLVVDLKCSKLIPKGFHAAFFKTENTQFTTILTISLKD